MMIDPADLEPRPMLRTRRLVLRPFALTDADEVQRLAGEREIAATTLSIPHPYEDGMAEEWIGRHEAAFREGREVVFAITVSETGELVGAAGLTIAPGDTQAELGYWIGRPFWGRGFATEATRAVLDHGFRELRLRRIHAGHFGENRASGRVLEKIGMTYEGCRRKHIRKWDRFHDRVDYGILREDFESSGVSEADEGARTR